ncbi:MAG: iron-containing redox enzyme family protein [Alphaproteobacteria bacterium]|nr:iron-containing redox enzyme family protein [Alphaproteobacteria bacterium]
MALHNECAALEGPAFERAQIYLARFNRLRLTPTAGPPRSGESEEHFLRKEAAFIEAALSKIRPLIHDVPADAGKFVDWFEALRDSGPGQEDALFPWLASRASLEEMKWFLQQEAAGEAGFDDLVALTQIKMPQRAKLEMARNYWDEMGRGTPAGMHGLMLERLVEHFEIVPEIETTVPEALAIGNVMLALACSRHYAFLSVGALGAIEMTAPSRVRFVDIGLKRLGVPAYYRTYFALHATLDVKHSQSWNREVIYSLVAEDERRSAAIAEGAVLRLWCGQRCFERYRNRFGVRVDAHCAAIAPREHA